MAAECTISLMAIPRGLASREQRDANPRRMANATLFLLFVLCHSVSVDVPLVTGRHPSHVPFFNQPSCSFHRYHVLVHSAAIGSPSSG